MKALVQSDDYGFTKAVIEGACDAMKNGIITSTGIFINMPICDYAIERIKEFPAVCLGIDINVSSGPSVSNPKDLKTLVNQKTGLFIQTSELIKDPRWKENVDFFKPYDEVYVEACAQVEKFIKLVGKKPEYLQSHSCSNSKSYLSAIKDAADKYGIKFSRDIYKKYNIKALMKMHTGDPFSFENQMVDKTTEMIELLNENINEEYVCLPSHCGFVDKDLMDLSRCNISRAYDHAYLISSQVKQWLEDHNVTLISYRDL